MDLTSKTRTDRSSPALMMKLPVGWTKTLLTQFSCALKVTMHDALLIDQSRRKQGIEVTFFGREATATPAAALLAMRCKVTVLPGFCVRDPDGRLTAHIRPPLEMIRTGDFRRDLQTNTQIMINAVEEMVREYPDQWFWTLKPWKVAYPHLYWEWEERRRKRKARKKRKRTAAGKRSSPVTPR